MPNYMEYQKSIATEFKAHQNRVRNIIDNHHWAEDGRYKEIILMNYLKRILPPNISVGTGFVKSSTGISKQIDIIIFNPAFPMLFSEGDFVIVIPESVLGIIEVKSKIETGVKLEEYIEKANYNASIICGENDRDIFNGIFSYECDLSWERIGEHIKNLNYTELIRKQHNNQPYSHRLQNCVNHVVCSSEIFFKFWIQVGDNINTEFYYSLYDMPEDLAVGYFISNLQEFIFRHMNGNYLNQLPDGLFDFFYPLPEGKEPYCKARIFMKGNSQENEAVIV